MKYLLLITFLASSFVGSAQFLITGKILDKYDEPLVAAEVKINGTYAVSYSDVEGKFTLETPASEEYDVTFSYLGFVSQTLKLNSSNSKDIKVVMMQDNVSLAEVQVAGTQASNNTPMAYTQVSEKEIDKLNYGQDLPYLLRMQPSLVTTSDAGAGIGYTGLRIRGSDASRINVTVNGIPLNDSESQGVFWVNMPDFGSSVNQIQIQRGVGTSTNGAGAFGGTVNLQTTKPRKESFFSTSLAVGSYNTQKSNLEFSTGMLDDKWILNGRLSKITSDGYVDRSASELTSAYLNAGLYLNKTSLQAVAILGHERTQQAWYGTPEAVLTNDQEGMEYVADWVFYMDDEDRENLLTSGRTYNYYTYENEVDDYGQDHFQLHGTHKFSPYLTANISGHYTRGAGYFEQFRKGDDLEDYGIAPIVIDEALVSANGEDEEGNPINTFWGNTLINPDATAFQTVALNNNNDTIFDIGGNPVLNVSTAITSGDFIRRRWLDNDFYGAVYSVNYRRDKINATVGGAYNIYQGDHFGRVIWAEHAGEYIPSNADDNEGYYYFSDATKKDFNIYGKGTYQINSKLNGFLDLQVRTVDYQTEGIDNDLRPISADESYVFFNPKFGATYVKDQKQRYYASFSVANREPTRSDIIDAPTGALPSPETLYDIEAGYYFINSKVALNANVYYMMYNDQLVLTGALNDVGSPIRTNVENSFRRGIELVAGVKLNPNISWNANLTLSQNKIQSFTESISDLVYNDFENTDISFSPNVVAGSDLGYAVQSNNKQLSINLLTKYVGKQYLDNTSNENKIIGDYLVNDLILRYGISNTLAREFGISLAVNNLLSTEYVSNGYTYSYAFPISETENFVEEQNAYYPQAPLNFILQFDVKF